MEKKNGRTGSTPASVYLEGIPPFPVRIPPSGFKAVNFHGGVYLQKHGHHLEKIDGHVYNIPDGWVGKMVGGSICFVCDLHSATLSGYTAHRTTLSRCAMTGRPTTGKRHGGVNE